MARTTTSLTANNVATEWIDVHPNDAGTVIFQLVPTGWTGTVTIQGTVDDGTTQITIGGWNLTDPLTVITTTAVSASQIIGVDGTGIKVRLKCTAYTAGSVAVTWNSARG